MLLSGITASFKEEVNMYVLYYVIDGNLSFAGIVNFIEEIKHFPFDAVFYTNGNPVAFRSKNT